MQNWLKYEEEAYSLGYNYICGIDEVGRGPLAGPVCAAAVILPKNTVIDGVNDSKKLSPQKREALYDLIKEKALAYSIAFSDVKEIEEINILNATMLAMKKAVDNLSIRPDYIMVDGNRMPEIDIDGRYIIKGDGLSISIASASILAKVARDHLMIEYAKIYPQYRFEQHKGYGTKLHIEMIKKYGLSDIHRPSFLKKIIK